MEDHRDCRYLGMDMWDCGHLDNCTDFECDCHVCKPQTLVERVLAYLRRYAYDLR